MLVTKAPRKNIGIGAIGDTVASKHLLLEALIRCKLSYHLVSQEIIPRLDATFGLAPIVAALDIADHLSAFAQVGTEFAEHEVLALKLTSEVSGDILFVRRPGVVAHRTDPLKRRVCSWCFAHKKRG